MKTLIILLTAIFYAFQLTAQSSKCKPKEIELRLNSYTLTYDNSGNLTEFVDYSDYLSKIIRGADGSPEKLEYYEDGEMYEWLVYKDDRVEYWDEDGVYETYLYEYKGDKVTKITRLRGDEEQSSFKFIWENGNIVEMTKNSDDKTKSYKYQYDDKANPLNIMKLFVDFSEDFSYASVLSENNISHVTEGGSESGGGLKYTIPVVYNENGCPTKMAENRDKLGYMEFTY